MKKSIYLLALVLASCGSPKEPKSFTESQKTPEIFPDYTEVTVPANIAPLNFMANGADKCVAVLTAGNVSVVCGQGNKVQIPENKWKSLLAAGKGGSIGITLYTQNDDAWTKWKSFNINVADEEIDRYLSYRLIEPSYVAYEDLSICQRDLESFEEKVFFSNTETRKKGYNQCINCHSYQNADPKNMLFHIRGQEGGTVLIQDGVARKLNMKRDGMISAAVYPAWHPTDQVIAFSTNTTRQLFHTHDNDKVEVQDSESHLILYDVERDAMIPVEADSSWMETFPTWSPDGKHLYYCSASYTQQNMNVSLTRDLMTNYKDVHYNLFVRDYDASTKTLGPRRLLLALDSIGQSATLPRVSPDGKKLLYASGDYGCFHIWHSDADINILDLETGIIDPLTALNGPKSDSYPSWSTNGRWIIMASRRNDGNFSRVFIAYYDRNGQAHKAFELPQQDPEFSQTFMKSYNRPELTVTELPKYVPNY